jgi:hypothetical protein
LRHYYRRANTDTTPVPEVVHTAYNLPEAPVSATVHLPIGGRDVMFTMRDTDEARLLVRLAAVLERFPVEQPASQPQGQGEGWCPIHNVQMRENNKQGRTWWSHNIDGQWCQGR